MPYWVVVDGQPHLVVPYSLTTNDGKFVGGGIGSGAAFYEFLKEAFDLLRAEGAVAPKMMSVGLHLRLAGHPARASGLAKFLDYVRQFDDVWVCTRSDIARHWIDNHPHQQRN